VPFTTPELLRADHCVESFDCGVPALNSFLKKHALTNQSNRSARTFVTCRDGLNAVGFYTLVAGSVFHAEAPPRMGKGLPQNPIPAVILARLAVDGTEQGKRLGANLLRDAMLKTLEAANVIGIRALIVHAKDDKAAKFYQRFDFQPWPADPLHLYLLTTEIKTALRELRISNQS